MLAWLMRWDNTCDHVSPSVAALASPPLGNLRQMPVTLARRIGGIVGEISAQNVSNYATVIMHGGTSRINISFTE